MRPERDKVERLPEPDQDAVQIYPLPSAGEAFRLIAARAWVVLLVLAGSVGLGLVGARLFHPHYQATAVLRLRAPSQARVGDSAPREEEPVPEPAEVSRRLGAALTSRPLLEEIIDGEKGRFAPWELADRVELIRWLAQHIRVDGRAGNLFHLQAQARDPEQARRITDRLAREALALHRRDHEQQAIRLEAFARQQVKLGSKRLKALEDRMVVFLGKHPEMRVKSLHADRLQLQAADRLRAGLRRPAIPQSLDVLAAKDPKLQELLARKQQLAAELSGLADSASTVTAALAQALSEAKSRLAELRSEGKKDSHPEVKQALRRIDGLEAKIAGAAPGKRTASSVFQARVQQELRRVDAAIKAQLKARFKVRARPAPRRRRRDLSELEAAWGRLRHQHDQLSEQYNKLQEVAVNAALKKNLGLYEAAKMAQIVERAQTPEQPIGLSRPLIVISVSALGLLAGLGLALLIGLLDTRLLAAEQVTRAAQGWLLLAVLQDHPARLLRQQRAPPPGLLTGGDGNRPLRPPGDRPPGEPDGSVIKWLKDTDDLDQAIALLGPGTGGRSDALQADDGQSPHQDAVAVNPLGGAPGSTGAALVRAEMPLARLSPGAAGELPRPRIRVLPSAPPLAPGLFVSTDPRCQAAEQMRLLAARLESRLGNALRVVSVVSWERGVGKTTVAANLAMVLAESQKRVLAIDACPGSAALTRLFGVEPNGIGLCEQLERWLDGASQPWELTQIAETLTVLPASTIERPALPLLASAAFPRLVSEMTHIFDAVVLDTTALQTASDAVALQKRVDGFVVVAGRGSSTTRSLQRVASRLDLREILGVVFNEHG